MAYANARLLLQAIDEMVEYYQGNEAQLTQQLLWFHLFLQRANLLPLQEKQQVEERLKMFEQLLEQDEWVRKQRDLGKQIGLAEGEQIGLAEGERKERKTLEEILLTIIQQRYPSLLALAKQRVAATQPLDVFRVTVKQLLIGPDETTARFLLDALAKG